MITTQQFRRLMQLSKTEPTLAIAAAKAGMDEKTARKWRRLGQPPNILKKIRTYRTRSDPFAEVWSEVVTLLERDASIEAVTLFEYLCRSYPDRFQAAQVRTLQRRLKAWRAQYGPTKEVFFPQHHVPGRQGQSDFTAMNELQVTIGHQPFAHLLYHFTLPYSNWEWAMVCATESFESLAQGLQLALWELGGVPVEHRTDSLSAAVNLVGERDEFRARYQGLLRHYDLQATHSSPGRGNENGDVEQAHHRFKKAVAQALLLRGSRNFQSRAEYEDFLRQLLRRRNQLRRERVQEEVATLRALPKTWLAAYTSERHRVTKASTIQVRNNFYSVASQLIGEWVEVRVYGEHLEVWYAQQCLQKMERLRGSGKAQINYRHVIHSLVRKPGAFAHYRYQPSLFPRSIFRVGWDELQRQHATQAQVAEREYLALLKLAADESEELVAQGLRHLLERGEEVSSNRVLQWVRQQAHATLARVPEVNVAAIQLQHYDQLLSLGSSGEVTR
jgi:hypothetical protein